jgi:DNA-binding transcriptional ArsR family regulator
MKPNASSGALAGAPLPQTTGQNPMTPHPLLSAGQDDAALAARALAHPLRARALELLTRSPASPHELATSLHAPLTLVSYHVRMLARLGFIELVATTPRRGAVEHRYAARARLRITIERL